MRVHLFAEEEKQTNQPKLCLPLFQCTSKAPTSQLQPPDTDTPIYVGGTHRELIEDLLCAPLSTIISYDKTH